MYSIKQIIEEQIEQFLTQNNIDAGVNGRYLTELVLNGEVYWEKNLHHHQYSKLVLLRLFSPVVMREEVFLGYVLLNCFLSRQMLLACTGHDLGKIALVGNDLENFYYLWTTNNPIEQLASCYIKTLEANLPDLYLASQDEERGIYGDLNKMFSFHKNNIEAFPIFAIPGAYVDKLGRLAREHLLEEIEANSFTKNPTVITANMSFFLSREGNENQSPYLLLARAASRYNLVSTAQLQKAFNLSGTYAGTTTEAEIEKKHKADIEDSLKKQKYDPEKVKQLFKDIVKAYHQRAESEPGHWSVAYCRGKALPLPPLEVIALVLEEVRLGFKSFSQETKKNLSEEEKSSQGTYCRSCGAGQAILVDNHIIMGEDVGKFHNQAINQGSSLKKICVRCSVAAYLVNKLVGSIPGNLAFVPQQTSIIFHYGQHRDEEVKAIAIVLKDAFTLIRERRSLEYEISRLRAEKKAAEAKLTAAKGAKTKQNYMNSLTNLNKEIQVKEVNYQECSRNLLAVLNRTKSTAPSPEVSFPDVSSPGALPSFELTLMEPALEIIADAGIALDGDSAEATHYVFGVGLGNYRLLAFVLPEVKHRLEKKAHHYMQQRFNNSRVTVLTLLAFLRKICGCDGPWYYLTLPVLTAEGFSTDAFYVRGRKYSARQVSTYYEAFSGFANKVIRRNAGALEQKILLTEKLLDEPLVVLAEVLRKSGALTRQDKPAYNIIYDPIAQKPALEEYLRYFKQFQNYQKFNGRDLI